MSRVISFSVDNQFADELDNLVESSGYDNRSRFLRDASLHLAEELQRGSLERGVPHRSRFSWTHGADHPGTDLARISGNSLTPCRWP